MTSEAESAGGETPMIRDLEIARDYFSLMGRLAPEVRSISRLSQGTQDHFCLSSGTDEMHAAWFLLTAVGVLPAKLSQVAVTAREGSLAGTDSKHREIPVNAELPVLEIYWSIRIAKIRPANSNTESAPIVTHLPIRCPEVVSRASSCFI